VGILLEADADMGLPDVGAGEIVAGAAPEVTLMSSLLPQFPNVHQTVLAELRKISPVRVCRGGRMRHRVSATWGDR